MQRLNSRCRGQSAQLKFIATKSRSTLHENCTTALLVTTREEEEYRETRLDTRIVKKEEYNAKLRSLVVYQRNFTACLSEGRPSCELKPMKTTQFPSLITPTRPTRRIKFACLQSSKPAGHELIKVCTKLHLCFYLEV